VSALSRRARIRAGIAVLALAASIATAPAAHAETSYPFRDPNLPLPARVDDLLSRLTLAEKISLLHQYQPPIDRLGVPAFRTGTEALHGVAWLGTATVFPQSVGLGNTWDPALLRRVGDAVGQEARGFNALDPVHNGLNLWAPVVNLLRDPRWGRNEEGYSEDPYLTGAMSTAYGLGLTGDNPRYLQAAPTLKHYLAYNNEANRDTTSSVVPPKILHDYDQQAFRPAIAAGAATGVMASYNLVNGRPDTVSPSLNDDVRRWAGQPLMNVSDAYAPGNLVNSEGYYPDQAAADAAAIKAGLDSFTQDDNNPQSTIAAVTAALDRGLLAVSDVDNAVRHILTIRFRLGDFDPPGTNPYAAITPAVIDSPAHRALARQAADEQAVLLKNTDGALPLRAGSLHRVAVLGPLSDQVFHDFYSGTMPYQVSTLDGIKERVAPGTTVASSDGVDRIALRDLASGGYVVAGTGADGAVLSATATSAVPAAGLDVTDWGQDVITLRAAANGRYVTLGGGHTLVNSETQPEGWFAEQQFKLDPQPGGGYVLEFVGYDAHESWFGPRFVTVDPDGSLRLGAATADAAARFGRELVRSGVQSAVAAARGADAAVVVVGSSPFINGKEAWDRQTIALAPGQEALVRAVRQANPHTIVVLQTSYPDSITWEQQHVPAILWTTHAGQETGHAIADVLFGDYNPSGRLTQTWYRSDADLPGMLDYDIAKSGATYLYHRGAPLYPFGYGLSYTAFRYGPARLSSAEVSASGSVTVSVAVTNTGTRAGTETVQLYTHERRSRASAQPLRQLRGFARVSLAPGQTRTVRIPLKASDLAFFDVTRDRPVVETGTYDLMVGASSAEIRTSAALRVRGETIPPRDLSRTTEAENFDDYAGVTLVDATRPAGTAVAATAAGQWVEYADAALRGAPVFTARVANGSAASATIAVRQDDPVHGRLLGTVTVPGTGDRYAWRTVSTRLPRLAGHHDIYLVLAAGAEMDTFRIS
jgi:beta-glucosidase